MRRPVRVGVVAESVIEARIVSVPVAVEPNTPTPTTRKTNCIIGVTAIGKVKHHDYVIAIAALVPPVKCNDLVVVVDMMHIHVMPAQAACIVEPQSYEFREGSG